MKKKASVFFKKVCSFLSTVKQIYKEELQDMFPFTCEVVERVASAVCRLSKALYARRKRICETAVIFMAFLCSIVFAITAKTYIAGFCGVIIMFVFLNMLFKLAKLSRKLFKTIETAFKQRRELTIDEKKQIFYNEYPFNTFIVDFCFDLAKQNRWFVFGMMRATWRLFLFGLGCIQAALISKAIKPIKRFFLHQCQLLDLWRVVVVKIKSKIPLFGNPRGHNKSLFTAVVNPYKPVKAKAKILLDNYKYDIAHDDYRLWLGRTCLDDLHGIKPGYRLVDCNITDNYRAADYLLQSKKIVLTSFMRSPEHANALFYNIDKYLINFTGRKKEVSFVKQAMFYRSLAHTYKNQMNTCGPFGPVKITLNFQPVTSELILAAHNSRVYYKNALFTTTIQDHGSAELANFYAKVDADSPEFLVRLLKNDVELMDATAKRAGKNLLVRQQFQSNQFFTYAEHLSAMHDLLLGKNIDKTQPFVISDKVRADIYKLNYMLIGDRSLVRCTKFVVLNDWSDRLFNGNLYRRLDQITAAKKTNKPLIRARTGILNYFKRKGFKTPYSAHVLVKPRNDAPSSWRKPKY